MYTCTCKFCGKEFQANFKDMNVCVECKSRPCEVCGKHFLRDWPYDQKVCSKECRHILKTDKAKVAEIELRKQATLTEKYGVKNVSKLDGVKRKIQQSKKDPESYKAQKEEEVANRTVAPLLRTCILCGKEFQAVGSQTTCEGPHYRKCIMCGKEFQYFHLSNKRKTCSTECKVAYRKQTISSALRTCQYCGEQFYAESNTAKYCKDCS